MARIQREDFDIGAETRALAGRSGRTGAVVSFLGVVRDFSKGEDIGKLDFEHYPGMAEKELEKLESEARHKFDIIDCEVIHRTGEIAVNGNIVLVLASSMHRPAAFDACEWLIDELKKRVPIWKKEFTRSGHHWVQDRP